MEKRPPKLRVLRQSRPARLRPLAHPPKVLLPKCDNSLLLKMPRSARSVVLANFITMASVIGTQIVVPNRLYNGKISGWLSQNLGLVRNGNGEWLQGQHGG